MKKRISKVSSSSTGSGQTNRSQSKKRNDVTPQSPVHFTIDLEKRRSFFNSLIERDTSDTEKYVYGERQRLPRVAVSPPRPKEMKRKKTTSKNTAVVAPKEVDWVDAIQGHNLDKSLYNGHMRIDLDQFKQGLEPLHENSEPAGEGDDKVDELPENNSLYGDDDSDNQSFIPKDYTYSIYPGGDRKEDFQELIVESRGDCFELMPRELRKRSIIVENGTLLWVGDTSNTTLTVEETLIADQHLMQSLQQPQHQHLTQAHHQLPQQTQAVVKQSSVKKTVKKQSTGSKTVKSKKSAVSSKDDTDISKETKEAAKSGTKSSAGKTPKSTPKKVGEKSSSSKSKAPTTGPKEDVSSPKTVKKVTKKSAGADKPKVKKALKKSGTPVAMVSTRP